MTQVDPQYDEDGQEIVSEPVDSPSIKAAREAATRADSRAAKAERENAILKALPGVDLETPLGKMFLSSYDGEPTTEAIRAAAQPVGLYTEPEAPVDPNLEVDTAAAAARADLNTGSVAPSETPDPEELEDPGTLGLKKFDEALHNGRSSENASAEFFDRVVSAAARGDSRAIWPGKYSDEALAGA